jgi:DNA-directed RNA polymerase specialized sigma24 family protein
MRDDFADCLLARYVAAGEDVEIDLLLTRILDEVARPIVSRIVASVLRHPAETEEAEDVVADTIMHLLRRLRALRADPSHPIDDLRGYIATCAYNGCHERLRERYPARNRLRNHLRYLLNHHSELAVWRSGQYSLVCGRREWIGRDPLPGDFADRWNVAARSDPSAANHGQIARLVSEAFLETGGPLELEVLVSAIARLINLDQVRVDLRPDSASTSGEPAADSWLELQSSLRAVWDDIRLLSVRQRVALLLNLRDEHGREILSLLPLTRTATMAQIADALQMPLGELAAFWNELPLSDAVIGRLLDASSQQVTKLRRLARERLRRMSTRREQSVTSPGRQNLTGESESLSTEVPLATRRGGSTP